MTISQPTMVLPRSPSINPHQEVLLTRTAIFCQGMDFENLLTARCSDRPRQRLQGQCAPFRVHDVVHVVVAPFWHLMQAATHCLRSLGL
jgi:hypothetical protein